MVVDLASAEGDDEGGAAVAVRKQDSEERLRLWHAAAGEEQARSQARLSKASR